VRFFKRWFNEDHVPHVPDVPTSEGQAHSGNEKREEEKPKEGLTPKSGNQSNRGPSKQKVCLTPESGDMRDIGDMEPTIVAIKSWCITNRDERSEISLFDLAAFIKEKLKQDPQQVTKLAFKGKKPILMPSPNPGKAVVI